MGIAGIGTGTGNRDLGLDGALPVYRAGMSCCALNRNRLADGALLCYRGLLSGIVYS